jgi:hypothetical protein
MGRMYLNPMFGFSVYPPACDAPTREHDDVLLAIFNHGKDQIAVKRSLGCFAPHGDIFQPFRKPALT